MRKLLLFTLGAMLLNLFSAKAAIDSTLCSVKFTLNMSEQIKSGAFIVGTDFVDVAGSFNSWDGTTSHLVKSDADDSIYTIQIDNIALDQLIEYKFRINGVWEQGKSELWGAAPNRKLQPRPLKTGGLIETTKYFDNYRTGYVQVNLSVNMISSKLKGQFSPEADYVDVAGSFNGWGGNDQLIGDDDKTIYSATVLAPYGANMEYKFRINGSWADDKSEFPGGGPNRKYSVKDTTGGVTNDVPTVFFNDEILDVKSTLVVPAYPTATSKVSIYINAKYYNFDLASDLSAWTGLITSESSTMGDWKYNPISDWNDLSVKLRRLNDSIHVFEITSAKNFYKVTAGVDVFRIAFIARDSAAGAVKSKTEDMFFEIYGGNPTVFIRSQPAKPIETKPFVVTVNINKSENASLAGYIDTATVKDVYTYTGTTTNYGAWKHEVTGWSNVPTNEKLKTIMVNDSVYRFYIMGSPRDFYSITDTCEHMHTANLVFRDAANGDYKCSDAFVQFDTASYKACEPEDTTTSISGIKAEISIYPNPAVEKLTVKSAATIKDITVTNIYGQQVMRLTNVNATVVPVSLYNVESGIYFISARNTNNQIISGKFIKR